MARLTKTDDSALLHYNFQFFFSIFYRSSKELLRAGSVDALIVLATQSVKNDFLYQEAFIATYRTFVSTHDLLEKLVQRFRKFNNRKDEQQMIYKRVAHCAFSLMVSLFRYLFIFFNV